MIQVLDTKHELSLLRLLLTYDQKPLDMLYIRKHLRDYYLNPAVLDGLFIGDVDPESNTVNANLWVTVRSREMVVQRPQGKWTRTSFHHALDLCLETIKSRNLSGKLHLILSEVQEELLDIDALTALGCTFTKTLYPARTHPSDKMFWWHTLNRVVYDHTLIFYKLEF